MQRFDMARSQDASSGLVAGPNFVNRTIWTGDNLDILRGLNAASADLIYLDPPFNSNVEYAAPVGSKAAGAAFKDTWTLSDLDVAWAGYIARRAPRCGLHPLWRGDGARQGDAVLPHDDGGAVAGDAPRSQAVGQSVPAL